MNSIPLSLLLASTTLLGQEAPKPSYLAPGTPEVGGVRHLCLIYHGMQSRVPWTSDAIMPYVAYVDEDGVPTDWLFDSFLFIEFLPRKHFLQSGPKKRIGRSQIDVLDLRFR